MSTDYQKNKVYRWENKFISPKLPKNKITIELAQTLVSHIWNDMGYVNSPRVNINPRYKKKSTGNRYDIELMTSMLDEHTVVHELAHSLNLKEDRNNYDQHGPNFVADFCFLLNRYYKIDVSYLLFTLKEMKVDINFQLLMNWMNEYKQETQWN